MKASPVQNASLRHHSVKYIKRAYTIPLAQGDQTCACLLNMFTYRHTIFHSVINYKQIIFYSPFCFRIGVFGGKIVWRSLVLSLRTCNAVWVSQSQRVTDRSLAFIPPAAQRGGLSRRCHAHGTLAKRLMRMAMAPKSGTTSGVSGFRETCVSRSLTLRVETNEAFSRWTTLACHRLARVAACCNHCSHALLQRGYAICASPAQTRHLRFSSADRPSAPLQRGHAICASPARSRHRRISSAVTPSALLQRGHAIDASPARSRHALRVYMALRGSDCHEASKHLQIFFFKEWFGSHIKLKPQSKSIIIGWLKTHYTGTAYLIIFYCLIIFSVLNFQ